MTPQPRLGMLEPTTSERTNVPYRRIRHIVAFAAVVAWLTSGCTNAADKQSKDAPKNVGVSISGKGTYPPDFLAKVPKPELALETAIGTAGTFRLRFTSSSATSDLAAYKNLLVTACYTMSNETKDLAGPSKRATLLATKDAISIVVSAFGPDAPGGGYYMAGGRESRRKPHTELDQRRNHNERRSLRLIAGHGVELSSYYRWQTSLADSV